MADACAQLGACEAGPWIASEARAIQAGGATAALARRRLAAIASLLAAEAPDEDRPAREGPEGEGETRPGMLWNWSSFRAIRWAGWPIRVGHAVSVVRALERALSSIGPVRRAVRATPPTALSVMLEPQSLCHCGLSVRFEQLLEPSTLNAQWA